MLAERLPVLRLFLHLTRNCNMRCRYCYAVEKVPLDMTREVGEKAIDRFMEATDHLRLQFFGGEPLMMFELMRGLHAYSERRSARSGSRASYSIITNGTLFDEEVAEFCKSAGIAVTLSFDGNKASHDASRVFPDGQGTFDTINQNLDRMLALPLFVHVVLNEDNVAKLGDSIAFLLQRGVRTLSITPDYSQRWHEGCLKQLDWQLAQVAAQYVHYRRHGEPVVIDCFDEGTESFERPPCRFGQEIFSVDPIGRIYPCCSFVELDVLEIGDVSKGLDPERYARLQGEVERLERRIREDHSGCPEHSLCRRGCGCANICSGRASDISPAACRISSIIAKHRSRVVADLAESPDL